MLRISISLVLASEIIRLRISPKIKFPFSNIFDVEFVNIHFSNFFSFFLFFFVFLCKKSENFVSI